MHTVTRITTTASDDDARDIIGNILATQGYTLCQYKRQTVWKKGNGWLTAPRIFKIDKQCDQIIIESWIPFTLLPGVYIGESGLDTFFGIAIKMPMRRTLLDLIHAFDENCSFTEGYIPNK